MDNSILYVDINRCVGCYACEIACRQEYNIPLGEWRIKVIAMEPRKIDGKPSMYFLPVASENCTGCEPLLEINVEPACVSACPTKAIQYSDTDQLTDTINKGKPISILKAYRENIEC